MKNYYIIVLLLTFTFSVNAQNNVSLLSFIDDLNEINLGNNFKEAIFSQNKKIAIDEWNSVFLQVDNTSWNNSYYWNFEGEKYDDGTLGKVEVGQFNPSIYVHGKVNLNSEFITIFFTLFGSPYHISSGLLSYSKEGEILSGIDLFFWEANDPSTFNLLLNTEDYYFSMDGEVFADKSISVTYLVDDVVRRLFVLDDTGHFREVNQVLENFPDNYDNSSYEFLRLP